MAVSSTVMVISVPSGILLTVIEPSTVEVGSSPPTVPAVAVTTKFEVPAPEKFNVTE